MTTYERKILTLLDKNRNTIGYLARADHLFPVDKLNSEPYWFVTRSLITPDWKGNFATRKQARLYLENNDNNVKVYKFGNQ